MDNILNDYTNSEVALMLRQERANLTREATQLAAEIRQRQTRLDAIDQRLREVDEGERVLSGHGT